MAKKDVHERATVAPPITYSSKMLPTAMKAMKSPSSTLRYANDPPETKRNMRVVTENQRVGESMAFANSSSSFDLVIDIAASPMAVLEARV